MSYMPLLKKFYIWQNGMCITYLLSIKKMESYLIQCGWVETTDYKEADYIIIGACASFLPYLEYFRAKIGEVRNVRAKIIVYGCVPAVDPKFFHQVADIIDLVIPILEPQLIEEVVDNPRIRWVDIPEATEIRRCDCKSFAETNKFIAIQEGCTEDCAYCMHKIAIGPERSKPLEQILRIIEDCLRDKDNLTFFLDGENAGAWGQDFDPPLNFPCLIEQITNLKANFNVILLNLSPKWLLKYSQNIDWLTHDKIKEIKIPIQTASKRLLSLMGRDPNVLDIGPIISELRKRRPDLLIRTEIIIGLPTETEEDLLNTLTFVLNHFDRVACFSYDYYPNTRISQMGIPLLSAETIDDRVKLAMEYFRQNQSIVSVFDDRGQACERVLKSRS